jgi:hypothetical protein
MAAGEMSILGRTGDTKIIWNPENEAEVEAAREHFNALRAKHMLAFSVKRNGDKGEQITEFDPEAKSIILAPQIRGGI